MYGLTDERVNQGEVEQTVDQSIDDDIASAVELPKFEWEELKQIINLQKEAQTQRIIHAIENNTPTPGKTEILAETDEMQNYYKNKSLFKISKQKILFRIWIEKTGEKQPLIVVGKEKYSELATDAHFNRQSTVRHTGYRKCFAKLSKQYYSLNGRQTVNKIVNKCAVCKLNNFPRGNASKTGNQIDLAPNNSGQIDFVGPIFGFAQTPQGNPRYLLVYVDSMSRYTIVVVTSSTNDNEVLRSLKVVKDKICGLPRRLFADNALLTPNSASALFCRENGVEIVHGLAYVSRSQAKIERQIQNVIRMICKLHTENESLPFQTIVEDAMFVLNSAPSDGLGGKLSPKDFFFANAPSNFPQVQTMNGNEDPVRKAREEGRKAVIQEVKRFMRNQIKESPSDYTNKLRPGTLVLKKRTSFPSSSPKKLAYKLTVQGFKVLRKVATNTFEVEEIRSKERSILPGDQLVKVSALNEEELKCLVDEMEEVVRRENVDNTATRAGRSGRGDDGNRTTAQSRTAGDADDGGGPEAGAGLRRSRRLRGEQPEIDRQVCALSNCLL